MEWHVHKGHDTRTASQTSFCFERCIRKWRRPRPPPPTPEWAQHHWASSAVRTQGGTPPKGLPSRWGGGGEGSYKRTLRAHGARYLRFHSTEWDTLSAAVCTFGNSDNSVSLRPWP